MKQEELTFNDLPAVVGELCNRIASMENLLTGKTFQAARSQREHTRTHDRAGGLRLSQNAVIDLLLQGQKRTTFRLSNKGNISTSIGTN